jgi:hypothetical protein
MDRVLMLEKRWKAVSPQSLIADGTIDGKVEITNTLLFKVKQRVILTANGQENQELEVKEITSSTTMYVGPKGGNIKDRTNLLTFRVSTSAAISANEQPRSQIPEQEIGRFTYDEEPTSAYRSVLVDALGNKYSSENPLPVDATVTANVDVELDHTTDSVKIGDGENILAINPDGSINTAIAGTAVSTPVIVNTLALNANSEYALELPANTRRFSIRIRETASLRLAFIANSTTTNYVSLSAGCSYNEEGLILAAPLNIYVSTPRANSTIELLYWT